MTIQQLPVDEINEALSEGELAILPSGTFFVDQTIVLPKRRGGLLMGTGGGQQIRPGHRLDGTATQLIWNGEPDGVMVRMQGAYQKLFGLVLCAKRLDDERPSNVTGVIVEWISQGLGTGKHKMVECSFNRFDVGFKCGTTDEMRNCDELTFDKCVFERNRIGYWNKNSQAMGHRFSDCQFRYNEKAVNVSGGGMITIDGALVIGKSQKLFYFDGDNKPKYRPGRNNSFFTARDVKIDKQSDGFMFCDHDEGVSINASLAFYDCLNSTDPSLAPAFRAMGATRIDVARYRGSTNTQFAVDLINNYPQLNMERVR